MHNITSKSFEKNEKVYLILDCFCFLFKTERKIALLLQNYIYK